MEELAGPLSVTLTFAEDRFDFDVTDSHLFLGYKPLVIGIVFPSDDMALQKSIRNDRICLSFNCTPFERNSAWKGMTVDRKSLARILLRKQHIRKVADATVIFYEGLSAIHRFLKKRYQLVNHLLGALKKQKAGNVSLPGQLYDMVRIAYSIPRIISLVTLVKGDVMNMFPTDLHGPVSDKFYISSLRKTGKASAQVESIRKIALSTVPTQEYKNAYGLGRNHMRDLNPVESFECRQRSRTFRIPLPDAFTGYRELECVESFDAGIHRLHIYRIEYVEKKFYGNTLAHIHRYYAQWRVNHGLVTNMLLR